MGLDAIVHCRCLLEGRVAPLPFLGRVVFDEEGYPTLDLPWEGHSDEWAQFWSWQATCCSHPGMAYASEHISNWSGYRIFQAALGEVGWDNFPTLHAELPNGNGGTMEPRAAARALAELAWFREHADLGPSPCLVDSETGLVLRDYVDAYDGIFTWSAPAGVDIGFDAGGLFIVESSSRGKEGGRELFRARRLQQVLREPQRTERHEGGDVEYSDLDSGTRFVCRAAVSGQAIPWPDGRMQDERGRMRFSYPRFLHVEERRMQASAFEYILRPLESIFRASVEIQMPVVWT